MGLGGISIWQLLIILAIVVMLFGTSRLRNIGGDLGKRDQRLSRQHEAKTTLSRHDSASVEREESLRTLARLRHARKDHHDKPAT